jgi:hypothetical protein
MGEGEVSVQVAVVHFKGECAVTDLSSYPAYPFTLGSTASNNGDILPFTDIYCNAIRAVIASQLLQLEPKDRAPIFGRAIGRVIAHELYHILAHTKHHGADGLAKRAWQPQELLAAAFRLNPKEMQTLRFQIVPTLLQSNGIISKAVVEPGKATYIRSGCVGCHGIGANGSQWGPSLYSAGNSIDYARLRLRLADTQTMMYRCARDLGVLWPTLTEADSYDLVTFLKSRIQADGRPGTIRDPVP